MSGFFYAQRNMKIQEIHNLKLSHYYAEQGLRSFFIEKYYPPG